MSRRARYDGPHLEVAVFDPKGTVYDGPIATVERGHLLPAETPAYIRDELLAREDWTEVKDPGTPAKPEKGE